MFARVCLFPRASSSAFPVRSFVDSVGRNKQVGMHSGVLGPWPRPSRCARRVPAAHSAVTAAPCAPPALRGNIARTASRRRPSRPPSPLEPPLRPFGWCFARAAFFRPTASATASPTSHLQNGHPASCPTCPTCPTARFSPLRNVLDPPKTLRYSYPRRPKPYGRYNHVESARPDATGHSSGV